MKEAEQLRQRIHAGAPIQDRSVKPRTAAHIIGISHATLRDWRFKRQGPPWWYLNPEKKQGCRYRLKDIVDWMEKRFQESQDALEGGG